MKYVFAGLVLLIMSCQQENQTSIMNASQGEENTILLEMKVPDSLLPKLGKYGCTASKYSNGYVAYNPKGSFTIDKNGTYTYYGFKEPSKGTYSVDEKGNLHFSGGYFDKGVATKIDRPNKFFLTFPGIPEYRWTCGCTEK